MNVCPPRTSLQRYVDNQLTADESIQVMAHVETCSACQRELGELTASAARPSELALTIDQAPERPDTDREQPETVDQHLPARPESHEGERPIDLPASVGRYVVGPELKKGGMGRIVRVWDADFNRPLALKLLRGRDPRLEQRQSYEGRLTGCLQHPGIPPVHDQGQLPDGRPYFIMKLIQGASLSELLRRRASPAAELPRFLLIFEQLCEAVGYAHSRQVIHRDLKPSNVMVGAFGEVQVIDWGLAKELRKEAHAPRSGEESPAGVPDASQLLPPSTLTQLGAALGTPAYMPPEQARGELDRLDSRSDVFGLGAILCEMLTGSPPYRGRTGSEVFERAGRADLQDAWSRLENCAADRDLIVLARACLATDLEARPANGAAVAAAMAAHRHEVQRRLQAAEIETASAAAQAEEQARRLRAERQRRRTTVALAAVVVVLVVGGSAAGWLYQEQQADRERRATARALHGDNLNKEIRAALAETEGVLQKLHLRLGNPQKAHELLSDPEQWRGQLQSAQSARQRGRSLAEGDPDLLEPQAADHLIRLWERLDREEAARKLAIALDRVRLKAGTVAAGKYDLQVADREYPGVFVGADLDVVQGEAQAVAARIADSPARFALVAALDHWASVCADSRLQARLLAISRLADPDPWHDRFRDVRVWADLGELQKLAADVKVREQSPQVLAALAGRLDALGGKATELLRTAVRHHPRDFWLHFDLGKYAPAPGEQARWYQAALAIRPGSGPTHNNLGVALFDLQDYQGAIAQFEMAIQADPNYARAYYNLGVALHDRKDLLVAAAQFRKAIACDSTMARAYYNLAVALEDQGDQVGAISHYRKAVELDKTDVKAFYNLGIALYEQKDLKGAVAQFRAAVKLKPDYGKAYYNLGNALRDLKEYKDAAVQLREAIRLDETYPPAHYNLGVVLLHQGLFREALDANRACEKRLPERHPWHKLVQQQRQQCEWCLATDRKLADYLDKGVIPEQPQEVLALIQLCRTFKQYHATAARLYTSVFAMQAELAEDLDRGHRYQAASSALLAAAGQGGEPGKLTAEECTLLRTRARNWLEADLQEWTRRFEARDVKALPGLVTLLPGWQQDEALAPVRDAKQRNQLPAREQAAWGKLWGEVELLLKQVAANVRTERFMGTLTTREKERVQEVNLQAGQVYLIDLESQQFDTFLRLHDAKDKLLAENDDIAPDNLNSRLIFTAPADGTYRLVATSFEQRGSGAYTLTVRSFAAVKK